LFSQVWFLNTLDEGVRLTTPLYFDETDPKDLPQKGWASSLGRMINMKLVPADAASRITISKKERFAEKSHQLRAQL